MILLFAKGITGLNISQLLVPQAILLQQEAQDATAIISRLGQRLYELGYVNDGFIEATLRREASMPTGLPLGGDYNAAMPHVDLEYVCKPALALATLQKPVVFHHMVMPEEEVPVQLVIMLALDQPKSQIEALQGIAELLQNPTVISGLMGAKNQEDVFAILAGLETVQ
jgi:galactitol PTS system EIIA component